jgi:oligopeptidase B
VHPHPPIATPQPNALSIHGDDRIDPYYWLRDRENPDVIAYLEAENDYAKVMLADTETLQQQLYEEMLGRIQETDLSVPVFHGGYYYYTRTEEGKAYGIHCRKQGSLEAPEEILIDSSTWAILSRVRTIAYWLTPPIQPVLNGTASRFRIWSLGDSVQKKY